MILVTGGAGFIGSALISQLNRMGREDIILVDRFGKSEKWKNVRGLKFYEYFMVEDFFHNSQIEDLFDELDFIFHLGACSSTTEMDMDYLMENNVNYTKNLLAYASEKDIPVLYASSAATYGAGERGYNDNEQDIENLIALNPYGYSKQLVDEWIVKNKSRFNRWYGVKFFNVYGPNEYHKGDMRSLVHKSFGQIKENKQVELFMSHRDDFKDGEQLRDFIYVKDAVSAMLELMINSNAPSGIYNLGTGVARSFKDLACATFKAMDCEVCLDFIPMPESIRGQYQYFTQAKMDKLFKACPNLKFHSLEEGITDYVQNYLLQEYPYLSRR